MASTDPLAPIVTAAAATSRLLLAGIGLWLLVALLLTIAARTAALGTRAAHLADALLRRLAPAAVRRAIAVAVGLALSLGPSPAGAETSPPGGLSVTAPASPAPVSPAASGSDDAAPVLHLDWPGATPSGAGASLGSRGTTPAGTEGVVVRPGDSLWRIAERALRADASPRAVASRHVAAHWPLWWQANREVIGDDPDLILPGAHLVAPPH